MSTCVRYDTYMQKKFFVVVFFVTCFGFFVANAYTPFTQNGNQITCFNDYNGRKLTYTLPNGAENPGLDQHLTLSGPAGNGSAPGIKGKTFYTPEMTVFDDATIGCAWGACNNSTPGIAHRTWPKDACVAVCDLKTQRCGVGIVMDRGPNTKLGCRTIDANPAMKNILGASGIGPASYKLIALPGEPCNPGGLTGVSAGDMANISASSATQAYSAPPSSAAQALNQMTGGALGNSPLGQFLGLQPAQAQPQQQTPINGVSGGGSIAPTYSGIGGTSAGAAPTTGSIPSVSGAGVSSGTNTPTVSLPLTDAVLGGDTLLTGTPGQATTTASQTINLNAPLGPIKNAPPTLLCIPGVVEPNEEALLFWSCNDASTSAEVDASTDESCETLGKTSGVMCARPASSTTYTLSCNAGTSAQCLIQVIQPRLAIIATPRSVVRGGVVDITWDTDDVSDCIVKSSTHPTFNRVGITGDVTSPSMYQDTTFTLLCEAETGTIKKKEITVDVL